MSEDTSPKLVSKAIRDIIDEIYIENFKCRCYRCNTAMVNDKEIYCSKCVNNPNNWK